jgi:polyphosphate glucokinase
VTDTPQGAPATATKPEPPLTIAIDVGGTGLKADVLDRNGTAIADRVRVPTKYPMPPEQLVDTLTTLVKKLPEGDRVSCGFPGMVRGGHVLSAPHFVCESGPGTKTVPKLAKSWSDFDLASALEKSIGKPTRVANDADVQGLAVVAGTGYEVVITLGTGFGTAFFMNGSLMPHMEFAHLRFRQGETFNEQVGQAARKKVGDERWNKRVRKAIAYLDALAFFDHLYIGGGNGTHVNRRDLGDVLERITVVENSAGILGGIKLWDAHNIGV